jgi:hypothetical protein
MPSRVAYIIMPVGSDPNFASKQSAIVSSLGKRGWIGRFPLDVTASKPDFLLPVAIEDMRTASLVVADLSLERPSCYYELAVAQTIGRPTFVIAAKGTLIHQLAGRGTVQFYCGTQELSNLLDAALI